MTWLSTLWVLNFGATCGLLGIMVVQHALWDRWWGAKAITPLFFITVLSGLGYGVLTANAFDVVFNSLCLALGTWYVGRALIRDRVS